MLILLIISPGSVQTSCNVAWSLSPRTSQHFINKPWPWAHKDFLMLLFQIMNEKNFAFLLYFKVFWPFSSDLVSWFDILSGHPKYFNSKFFRLKIKISHQIFILHFLQINTSSQPFIVYSKNFLFKILCLDFLWHFTFCFFVILEKEFCYIPLPFLVLCEWRMSDILEETFNLFLPIAFDFHLILDSLIYWRTLFFLLFTTEVRKLL